MKLDGIYAPIPTPFEDSRIAFDRLGENLEKWAETKLTGIVVLGSNGEFVYLDEDEKVALTEFTRRNFPAGKPVIAGTGCESTRATIRLTERCAAVGAEAALVLNPFYYRGAMTEQALVQFYTDVADASSIPVILYNMPRNTGLSIPVPAVLKLSHHPNIIGIKDSSGDIVRISETAAGAAPEFVVFAGSASFLYPALCVGAKGGTLAVANILPNHCSDIVEMYQAGRNDEACSIQFKILDTNAAVTSRWGVAGLKAAMDMIGYFGGTPRPPLMVLPEQQREMLQAVLQRVGII